MPFQTLAVLCAATELGRKYPNHKNVQRTLAFPDDSVERIRAVLQARGFNRVVRCSGPDATKTEALRLINDARTDLEDDGHFVFAFAGHGRHEGPDGFACLFHDEPLWRDELWRALSTFTGNQRITLVIDSCYAAGMKSPASFMSWARDASPPGPSPSTPPVTGYSLIGATGKTNKIFPTRKSRFAQQLEKHLNGRNPARDHRTLQAALTKSLPVHQHPTLVMDPPTLWEARPFGDGVRQALTVPAQGRLDRLLTALRAIVG